MDKSIFRWSRRRLVAERSTPRARFVVENFIAKDAAGITPGNDSPIAGEFFNGKYPTLPIVTLSSPANTSSTYDSTPALDFTGNDVNFDRISYRLQLGTDPDFTANFPSVSAAVETTFGTSVTSMPVDLPSLISPGDLLLAFVSARNIGVFSAPGEWSQLLQQDSGGVGLLVAFFKIADGTEASQETFSTDIATTAVWHTRKISNWYGSYDGIDLNVSSSNGIAGSMPNSPYIAPVWDNVHGESDILWVSVVGSFAEDVSIVNYPNEYSGGAWTAFSGGGSSCSLGTACREYSSIDEDPSQFSTTSSRWWSAMTIAIRPVNPPSLLIDEVSDENTLFQNKNYIFSDNFDDDWFDDWKWVQSPNGTPPTVLESGQKLIFTPSAVANGSVEVSTLDPVNITRAAIVAKIPQVADLVSTNTELIFYADDFTNAYELYLYSGTLYCATFDVGDVASIAYDSLTMVYWSIREEFGYIHFEYSADGLSWTTIHSMVKESWSVTNGYPGIIVKKTTSDATPGETWVEDFYVVDRTDPFVSGNEVTFTPSFNLDPGTYYWRVRAKDETSAYGGWSATRSFTVGSGGGTVVKDLIQMGILAFPR